MEALSSLNLICVFSVAVRVSFQPAVISDINNMHSGTFYFLNCVVVQQHCRSSLIHLPTPHTVVENLPLHFSFNRVSQSVNFSSVLIKNRSFWSYSLIVEPSTCRLTLDVRRRCVSYHCSGQHSCSPLQKERPLLCHIWCQFCQELPPSWCEGIFGHFVYTSRETGANLAGLQIQPRGSKTRVWMNK